MSTSVGDLAINISANIASLETGMARAADVVGKAGRDMARKLDEVNSQIDVITKSFGALAAAAGIGFGAKAFADFVTGTIDATENMGRMALMVGTTAEKLSTLVPAATLSGTAMDQVASAADKFSKQMALAIDPASKSAKALDAIGLSAKDAAQFLQDPIEGMRKVAQALDMFADDGNKAAVVMALYGKSGAELLPFLKELAQQQEVVATVTDEQTRAAKELTDAWRTLHLQSAILKTSLVSEITPSLTALIDGFVKATTGADSLKSNLQDLIARGQISAWAQEAAVKIAMLADWVVTVDGTFRKIVESIGFVVLGFVALARAAGGAMLVLSGDVVGGFAHLQGAMDATVAGWKHLQTTLAENTGSTKFQDAVVSSIIQLQLHAGAVTDATKPHIDFQAALAKSGDAAQKFIDKLTEEIQTFGLSKKALDEYTAKKLGILAFAQPTIDALELERVNQAALDAELKSATKDYEEYGKALIASQKAHDKEVSTLEQLAAKWNAEADAIRNAGKGHADAATITIEMGKAFGLSADEVDRLNVGLHAAAANKEAAQALADQAKTVEEAWKKTATTIEDALVSAFSSVLTKGKDLFQQLKDFALKLFETLVLRPILAPIAAGASSLLFPGAAGAAGAGGSGIGTGLQLGNSLFGGGGNIFSSIGNLFGNGGAGSGIFGAIGTSFTNMSLAASAGVDAIGGLGAALTSFLPGIGAIAAIAIPLLSGLFKSGGGPKQGGEAGLNYYASEVSAANNATIQATVDALGTSYSSMLASLGGKGSASFGLGYDTDPQGTAQNRVSSSATVGGQNVYGTRDVGVGRDAAGLQTALAIEAQRVVLAALKASDLPADIAKLFSSIDVPTASAAEITAIEKTAATYKLINDTITALPADAQKHFTEMLDGTQKTADSVLVVVSIIRTFGDAIDGLGPKLTALDPASINAFIDALGGAAKATASFAYLGQNFLTSAERLAQSTNTLSADFARLGVTAIPQTHEAFLALLNSFDLTTEAGRTMYASVLDLSSLFVAVHGTADQAATSVNGVSTALSSIAQSAETFFKANFYTAAEQNAQKYAAELKQVNDAQVALGVSIPTSVEGFRALIEGIDTSTAAGKALYAALIVLAPAVFDLSGAAATAVTQVNNLSNSIGNIAPSVNARGALQQTVDTFLQQANTVANQIANASVGDKIALQVKLIGQKILAVKDSINYFIGVGDFYNAETLTTELGLFQTANAGLVKQLAEFTTLKAQYGDAIAGQLVDLETWYDGQRAALAGNAQALGALAGIYADKWAAIIAGTSTGVTGTINQLQKLRDAIATYLQGLQVGTLSPLTPLEKLAQAKTAYEADLSKAQGGDQTALGDITKFADTYLTLSRDAFASSQIYTDIFAKVTGQLGSLAGTLPTGQAPQVIIDKSFAALSAALPASGTKLASQADITTLAAAIVGALAAHADAGTADTAAVTAKLSQTQAALADALAPLK